MEIIPFRVIKETQFKLNNTFDREWFTTYLFEKSDYKKLNYSNEQDQSKMRWTLDTPEDYEFFKKVFHHLFNPNKIFLRKDILNLLNQYQEYSGINNKFERNYAFYQALEKEESNGPKISFINNNLAGKKIMIIGCGSMGIKHLRNLNHNFKIETIACDASEKIIDEVKKEFPLQKTYLNLDEALRNEKPEYIIIATPNHLHLPLALKCLDYTKNIFIEKPISDKEEGVEKLLKQAREKGVKITVGFNMRFNPVIQKIKDLVKRDELGKITSMRINFCSYLPDRHPGKDYREDYVTKRSMGGGVILDMTHELDYLIWIFGQPIEVFSFAERRSNLEMETEDSADILIKLVSGSVANLHLDFIRRPYTRTIEVVGEKGTLLADLASNQIKVFHPERKEWEEIKFNQEHNETYIQELNHFLDFSAEEDKVSSSGESALKVLNMVNAIKESAQEGKVINIK